MQEATGHAGGSAGPGGTAGSSTSPGAAPDERSNPWFSIWNRPRATMRRILDTEPRRMVLPLAMMGGIASLLIESVHSKIGTLVPIPLVLAACFAGGAIGGIFGLYLMGSLVRLTGRWLGGQGEGVGLRSALAWSNVPTLWGLLLLPPWIALLGDRSFRVDRSLLEGDLPTVLMALVFALIQGVIAIWQLVVALKCIGEAHRFSAWLALVAVVLAGLILALPVAFAAVLGVLALR